METIFLPKVKYFVGERQRELKGGLVHIDKDKRVIDLRYIGNNKFFWGKMSIPLEKSKSKTLIGPGKPSFICSFWDKNVENRTDIILHNGSVDVSTDLYPDLMDVSRFSEIPNFEFEAYAKLQAIASELIYTRKFSKLVPYVFKRAGLALVANDTNFDLLFKNRDRTERLEKVLEAA